MEQAKFYSDEGVKERKEKLKLKMLINQAYSQQGKELPATFPQEEQAFRILQVHNQKVSQIRSAFLQTYEKRQASKGDINTTTTQDDENIQLDRSLDQQPSKQKKKAQKRAKKPQVDFEIKVKGEDGQVIKYTEDDYDHQSPDGSGEEDRPKKKGKKKKAASKIQSEETLEMLMNALKPQNTKGKKKMEPGEEIKGEKSDQMDGTEVVDQAKQKKATSKKKKTLAST